MTQRYKCVVQYDGTRYAGYQIQKNRNTIQAELEKALRKLTKGKAIPIQASGRTDAGVHALGQVIHFDYPVAISVSHLKLALNSTLPKDILIRSAVKTDEHFHARFNTKGKKYIYRVDIGRFPDPFKRLYTLHHSYRFDLHNIQTAIKDLEGTHDFTSFCSPRTEKADKVRTIYAATAKVDTDQNELVFTFSGNGFLYNMVRIFVGTLLQIGDGLRPVNEIKRLLALKDREPAGPTAPPQGLYLAKVYYDKLPATDTDIVEGKPVIQLFSEQNQRIAAYDQQMLHLFEERMDAVKDAVALQTAYPDQLGKERAGFADQATVEKMRRQVHSGLRRRDYETGATQLMAAIETVAQDILLQRTATQNDASHPHATD